MEDERNPWCATETQLQLLVNPKQQLQLQPSYSICGLQPSLELEMPGNFDTWEWLTQDNRILSTTSKVLLEEEGLYSLRVGCLQNGILCEETRSFKLLRSALPEIREVKFQDWSSRNYIEIIAVGDAALEYSIDGVHYTDSNYFENLRGGSYTVYARDKNGCGLASQEVVLLDYPEFFSQNNDGYNDHWQVSGFATTSDNVISIYYRYGSLLSQFSTLSQGWDGTYNGKPMPADDYWFSLQLPDGKIYKNHFSLLR